MLEILLSLGGKQGGLEYPESGPGTKILQFGDETLGYFGEVSSDELMSNAMVWEFSGAAGTPHAQIVAKWMKCFIDKKVIYIAKQPIGLSTWNNLYAAGVVYGRRGYGSVPSTLGSVDQLRITFIKEQGRQWPLKLRLLRGLDNEVQDNTNSKNSEWDRLFQKLYIHGYEGVPWVRNTYAELAGTLGLTSLTMDTWTRSTDYTVIRGSNKNTDGDITTSTTVAKTSTQPWRPVFELVEPGSVVFTPMDLAITNDLSENPALYEVEPDYSLAAKSPQDIRINTMLTVPPSITEII